MISAVFGLPDSGFKTKNSITCVTNGYSRFVLHVRGSAAKLKMEPKMDSFLGLIFGLFCFVMWLTAVIHDASNNIIGWLIADIFVFPVGVVRGALIFFGGI